MGHYVFRCDDGGYIGTRKNVGDMYVCRTSIAKGIMDARIFNTKAAATNSGRQAGHDGQALQVRLIVIDD